MDLDPSLVIRQSDEVYPPSEDSYLLLRAIDMDGASAFLEVGTGTGIIALHAALHTRTVATDINPHAVDLCMMNARQNRIALQVVRTDLFSGLKGAFDVIAFNPPYLPEVGADGWIDRAWSGGSDGNEVILRFLDQAGSHLSEGGRIFLLLSSRNGRAAKRAQELYRVRSVQAESLFFERIGVYELRHRGNSAAHKL